MNNSKIEIKICGIRDPENIEKLCRLNPLYIGFDFRATSSRYIGEIDEALLMKIPHTIRKIGVFDDQSPLYMSYIAGRFSLTGIQLETDITHRSCEILAAEGLEIIKVVNAASDFDKYEGICNKFLLRDKKFLQKYSSQTPLIIDFKVYNPSIAATIDIVDDFEYRVAMKNADQIENWLQNNV